MLDREEWFDDFLLLDCEEWFDGEGDADDCGCVALWMGAGSLSNSGDPAASTSTEEREEGVPTSSRGLDALERCSGSDDVCVVPVS